jgi:hypothetical protein
MVVTGGIQKAIRYFHAFRDYLKETKSQYKAIVAFYGEPEYGGLKVTEASLNGLPSGKIEEMIEQGSVAPQPLLHPRFPPTILVSLTTSQVLRRPPEVT